jgi:hypothetical protein
MLFEFLDDLTAAHPTKPFGFAIKLGRERKVPA